MPQNILTWDRALAKMSVANNSAILFVKYMHSFLKQETSHKQPRFQVSLAISEDMATPGQCLYLAKNKQEFSPNFCDLPLPYRFCLRAE